VVDNAGLGAGVPSGEGAGSTMTRESAGLPAGEDSGLSAGADRETDAEGAGTATLLTLAVGDLSGRTVSSGVVDGLASGEPCVLVRADARLALRCRLGAALA
jgi:hypothetical protein